ncbi:amidohydrolase [Nocardia sp. NEAU-G5]|uniref:Amidohydrolase n=1 Tax=Nocardia albiluteola TaxID=2842303 RepID=A0ABS6AX08_9NOCA|nr:amidohydrolase family protein [Nocardia albiluteola]MBU3062601.1 amidohydrolase [Nocardia albiluteola]MBU3065565.1 amidohydrolase [Nocardia albiluteola]
MIDSARIDVHQHVLPPSYGKSLTDQNLTAAGWPLPSWSADSAVEAMDKLGIATGILSVSAPGTHFGDDAKSRELSRANNEFTAEVVKDRPARFGLFASLPLPDVDGAAAEAVYALDTLRADGVVLMANARGRYLGDPAFEPLWAELDARGAVVFVHPNEMALPMLPGTPGPIVDFPFDTTRTAVDMAMAGVLTRYPNMKVILSHAGGALPYLAHRVAVTAGVVGSGGSPEGILTELRRFYFDTALSGSPTALPALQAFADPSHILYGSDWPFAPSPAVGYFDNYLDTHEWPEGQLHAVNRGNAEILFPRLAS